MAVLAENGFQSHQHWWDIVKIINISFGSTVSTKEPLICSLMLICINKILDYVKLQ